MQTSHPVDHDSPTKHLITSSPLNLSSVHLQISTTTHTPTHGHTSHPLPVLPTTAKMLSRNPFLALVQVPFWSVILLAPLILYLLAHHGKSKRKEKTIRLPPSPLRLPFIGHLHLMVKEPQRTLQRLAHRLGPVIYLQLGGVPAVVVSSPEAAKEVLKILDVHCCNRPSSPGRFLMCVVCDLNIVPFCSFFCHENKSGFWSTASYMINKIFLEVNF